MSRQHLRSNLVCFPCSVRLCLKIMLFLKILWVGSTASPLLSLDLIMSLLSAGEATGMERPRMALLTASEADVGSWLEGPCCLPYALSSSSSLDQISYAADSV